MNRIVSYLILFVICLGTASAQVIDKQHSLVGIWQYTNTIKLDDGREVLDRKPIYKIINADNTYQTMAYTVTELPEELNIPNKLYTQIQSTVIIQKGTYEIENDSIYNEFITEHIDKSMTVSASQLRYKYMYDKQDLLRIEYFNENLQKWFAETWTRVVTPSQNRIVVDPKIGK